MSSIRVLIVAYDFPPHAAMGTQRTLRVVRRLVDSGWDVTVLTGDPRSFRRGTPVDAALLDRVPDRVRVVRARAWRPVTAVENVIRRRRECTDKSASARSVTTPTPRRSGGSLGTRCRRLLAAVADGVDTVSGIPDAEIGWLLPAVAAAVRQQWRARPDVIYSSAPPWTGHLAAASLASLFRRPLVLDFRDPWARAPWRSARSSRFFNKAASRLERFVVRRATAVIFATHATASEFAERYGARQAAKFHAIPNGCDATLFDGIPHRASNARELLLHAGSLYGKRNPLALLRVLSQLMSAGRIDGNLRVRFVGPVSLPGVDLIRECRELGLEHVVEFIPRLSHREILHEMRAASALLLFQPGTTMSVPAKAYEYLAAGRPVLALTEEGETAELIRAGGIGCAVAPDDHDAIAAGVLRILELARLPVMPASGALFDGSLRAAETEAVLAGVVHGAVLPAGRQAAAAGRV